MFYLRVCVFAHNTFGTLPATGQIFVYYTFTWHLEERIFNTSTMKDKICYSYNKTMNV